MDNKKLSDFYMAGSNKGESNTHLGNVFLCVENGKLAAIQNPNCMPKVTLRGSNSLTEEKFCELCQEASVGTNWNFKALISHIATCYSEELNTEITCMPADAAARLLSAKSIPEAFALMPLLSGVTVSLKKAASLYRAEEQRKRNNSPDNIAEKPTSRQTKTTQLLAVGRILDQQNKLVGLILSDGAQQIRNTLDMCITKAQNGKIKNVKAMTRNGKTFLAGNGVSLEALPHIQVQ